MIMVPWSKCLLAYTLCSFELKKQLERFGWANQTVNLTSESNDTSGLSKAWSPSHVDCWSELQ